MSLWTEDDSRDLDTQIKALRRAERAEQVGTRSGLTREDVQKIKAADPGLASIRPMYGRVTRRAPKTKPPSAAERSLPEPKQGRPPKPRLRPNGRWLAVINRNGVRRERTCNTEAEAQAWLDAMERDQSWHDAK